VPRDGAEDTVQCADAKNGVIRYSKAVMRGFFRLKDDVAALLMDHAVSPITA